MKINRSLIFIIIFLFIIFSKNNSFATYDFEFPSFEEFSITSINDEEFEDIQGFKYYCFYGGFRDSFSVNPYWYPVLSNSSFEVDIYITTHIVFSKFYPILNIVITPSNPDEPIYIRPFRIYKFDGNTRTYSPFFYSDMYKEYYGRDYEDGKIVISYDSRETTQTPVVYFYVHVGEKILSTGTYINLEYYLDSSGSIKSRYFYDDEGNIICDVVPNFVFKSNVNVRIDKKYFWKDPEISNTDRVTLYIDDMNFRKRFSFIFKIPLLRDDTKYYVFLDKYTRNSYDSVTASFKIYTVTTPEGYDYTDYKNYMYYDDTSKKLVLPAGCEIYEYSTTVNNGEEAVLKEETSYIATREDCTVDSVNFYNEEGENAIFPDDLIETIPDKRNVLIDTNYNFTLFNPYIKMHQFFLKVIDYVPLIGSLSTVIKKLGYDDFNTFFYNKCLYFYFYSENSLIYTMDDFCFSNYSIVSYQCEYQNNYVFSSPYYEIYRHTKIYNRENALDSLSYSFNFSDGQDVSSMLSEDTNNEYLTSPFFKNNDNSSSGGNITYNITEVIEGDKIINYGREESPYRDKLSDTYIENFNEGDNIIIETESTEDIEKTSQMLGILQGIYWSVLNIEAKMSDLGSSTTNFTENFTYNTHNTINKFFVPSQVNMTEKLTQLNDDAKTHLGIIYEPISVLVYTVTLFTNIDNQDEIKFEVPEISFKGVTLIENKSFSFTSYMENLPVLYKIHQIYLTAVDFLILGLLVRYAIKVSKEVFHK